MGNATVEQQFGTPIDNNLIALLVTGQTEKVISKLESEPDTHFLQESINFRGDTLLHYACAKNNVKLVDYIIKKNPNLMNMSNNLNQKAADLTSNESIRSICTSKSQPKSMPK